MHNLLSLAFSDTFQNQNNNTLLRYIITVVKKYYQLF